VAEPLARFLAVKFIPPREVRRITDEKLAGAASSKWRMDETASFSKERRHVKIPQPKPLPPAGPLN
jgi:hypothetical protein